MYRFVNSDLCSNCPSPRSFLRFKRIPEGNFGDFLFRHIELLEYLMPSAVVSTVRNTPSLSVYVCVPVPLRELLRKCPLTTPCGRGFVIIMKRGNWRFDNLLNWSFHGCFTYFQKFRESYFFHRTCLAQTIYRLYCRHVLGKKHLTHMENQPLHLVPR